MQLSELHAMSLQMTHEHRMAAGKGNLGSKMIVCSRPRWAMQIPQVRIACTKQPQLGTASLCPSLPTTPAAVWTA